MIGNQVSKMKTTAIERRLFVKAMKECQDAPISFGMIVAGAWLKNRCHPKRVKGFENLTQLRDIIVQRMTKIGFCPNTEYVVLGMNPTLKWIVGSKPILDTPIYKKHKAEPCLILGYADKVGCVCRVEYGEIVMLSKLRK